jgi:hypothetical protein
MALFLEITAGEMQGTRTQVQDGLVLGRKGPGLSIRDSKVSSKHARVEHRSDGTLWLVDLKSANGIKTAKGRVLELKLESGAAFTLGRTQFQVITTEDAPSHDDMPTHAVAVTVTRTFWDSVREIADRGRHEARTMRTELVAFDPPLRLQFTRGTQSGTVWTLGYGPRMIGGGSLDLQLDEPSLAELCFRLEPIANADGVSGVLLKNEADTRVNGRKVDTAELKPGDTIELMNTQLLVVEDAR